MAEPSGSPSTPDGVVHADESVERPIFVDESSLGALDRRAIAAALAGDRAAFSELYRRHARYVAGIVFRLMGDERELDDAVQETFIAAADRLASIEEPERFRAWLSTIAVREVARRLARRRRQRFFAQLFGGSTPAHDAPVVDGEAYALYDALSRVSDDRRIPWLLHHVEGMTLPEVAERCGVSLATAKRRIAEADALMTRREALDGAPARRLRHVG